MIGKHDLNWKNKYYFLFFFVKIIHKIKNMFKIDYLSKNQIAYHYLNLNRPSCLLILSLLNVGLMDWISYLFNL